MATTTRGSNRKGAAARGSPKSGASRAARRSSAANRKSSSANRKKTGSRAGARTGEARASRSAHGTNDAIAARRAAVAGTKAAGRAAAAAATRAKTPLIFGGMAIAGIAGGVAVKNRTGAPRPKPRRRLAGLPWPIRDEKIDLDAVAAAARRVSTLGQQVADVAVAIQATRPGGHD
jgi:hypothetical protein